MSGVGKSTLLAELARRGHLTLDTDYDGWTLPDGLWDEQRMTRLLEESTDIVVSGTVANQGAFRDRFAHVLLLSAPVDVLLARVSSRVGNDYGTSAAERDEIRRHTREVEPLLRRFADRELDGRRPVIELAYAVERLLGGAPARGSARVGEESPGEEAAMEEVLEGGNTTAGVVRVGDTVRRPRGRRSPFIAELLRELETADRAWAPRYLGVDEHGRDAFAYVDGTTTDHPSQRDEGAYRQVGAMLRELHESTRASPLAGGGACVVHGDPGPYNVIMKGGLPVALIDWDSAHGGDPLEDVGYAGWTWCVQSVGSIPVADQARRLRDLVDGYGAGCTTEAVLSAVEAAQNRIIDLESQILASAEASAQRRAHATSAVEWARGDRTELNRHRETFRRALDRVL